MDYTSEISFILKPSSIGGVGVFTTHGIRRGIHLRLFPNNRMRIVKPGRNLTKDIFYEHFGISKASNIIVPEDFGCMDIGWDMNHSDNPTSAHNLPEDPGDAEYFATRDIQAGEEITINYRLL
jgi:hypothetical protein